MQLGMSKSNNVDLDEFIPENSQFYGLILFGWLISSFFGKYDSNRLIYSALMVSGAILSLKYLLLSRKKDTNFNPSIILVYVVLWFGITAFSNPNIQVGYDSYIVRLYIVEFLSLLPLLIIWLIPSDNEKFFGIQEMEEATVIKGFWKFAVCILYVVNFLSLRPIFEFLILIPLVAEAVVLQKLSEDRLPILTIRIEQELLTKFAVPVSLLRTISLILFAFMFNFLTSRFWVIILLLFILSEFIWMINNIATKFNEGQDSELEKLSDLLVKIEQESIEEINQVELDESTSRAKDEIIKRKMEIIETKNELTSRMNDVQVNTIEIHKDGDLIKPESNSISKTTSKAHSLGKKFRQELQKPQYNLNHILATLTSEDFSKGYLVEKENLSFQSLKGEWRPPKNLLMFPIELGEYDYRRSDEILLLGFNKPVKAKTPQFSLDLGPKRKKRKFVLTKNSIQIGDLIFNMQTLVLTKKQWKETSENLTEVTDEDKSHDISYTGFETLESLQTNLVKIGDKWLEIRKQAELAIVDFVSGFLGTGDAVFVDTKLLRAALDENENTDDVKL